MPRKPEPKGPPAYEIVTEPLFPDDPYKHYLCDSIEEVCAVHVHLIGLYAAPYTRRDPPPVTAKLYRGTQEDGEFVTDLLLDPRGVQQRPW